MSIGVQLKADFVTPFGLVPDFRSRETSSVSFWNTAYVSAVLFVSRERLQLIDCIGYAEICVFSNDEMTESMLKLGSFSREDLEIFFDWLVEIRFGSSFSVCTGRVFVIRSDGNDPIVCVFDMMAKVYGIKGRHRWLRHECCCFDQ